MTFESDGGAIAKSRAKKIIAMIYQSWQKRSARTILYLIGGPRRT